MGNPVILIVWSALHVVHSINRGDDLSTTMTYLVVILGCGGSVIGLYLWARHR